MQAKRRVVVAGLGAVTALGFEEERIWERLAAGLTGIRRIRAFDPAGFRCCSGAEVDDPALRDACEAARIHAGDRAVDMGLLAAARALGPEPAEGPAAVLFGTGFGSTQSLSEGFLGFAAQGVRGIRPTTVPRCMANSGCAQISMRFGLTGPNYAVVSACTSSTTAIGIGFRMVRDGYVERALCGGYDSMFVEPVYAAWDRLGVMSRNPEPERACRPFDADRDGCVLGEGAGALLLTSLDFARRHNLAVRAEVRGYGESSDARHLTRPEPEGQAEAMRAALADAGVPVSGIGCINAHGTATPANDACESRAIRLVFGECADRIPVVSNKSAFGHLLGASGVVETVAAVLSLEHRAVPPNLNLDHPDPECDVCLSGPVLRPLAAPCIVKNSFGFGGNNAVLVLSRWEDGQQDFEPNGTGDTA